MVEQEGVVERDEQPPRQQPAPNHDHADVQADDVADPEQRGRQVDSRVGDRALADVAGERERLGNEAQAGHHQLEQRAGERGEPEQPRAARPLAAGAQEFRGRDPLGELQVLVDDQRPAQRHGEQHAEQAAEADDREHPPVVEPAPVAEDDQRREREHGARRDRRSGRGAGGDDVVLEDAAASEQAQHPHRDHRRRDRGGDRETGKQPEVGVGRGQYDRQQDRQQDGTERQLRHFVHGHLQGRRGASGRCPSSA